MGVFNLTMKRSPHKRQPKQNGTNLRFALPYPWRNTPSDRMRGFTLIEILVVVVIIGILGAVIVPNLLSRPDQARITAAQQDLRALGSALDMYRLDNFQYPSTDQGLDALVSQPSGFPEPKNWNPDGYIKTLPTDPWGSPYMYEFDGSDVSVFSLGADGAEGGEGVAADIHLNKI